MKIKLWHMIVFVMIILAIAAMLFPTTMRTAWMLKEGDKVEEAIAKVMVIYKKNPKHYRAVRTLAQSFEKIGKVDEAKRYYKELLELKPNDRNFKETIRFYSWTEQPEMAMETYRRWYTYRLNNKKKFKDKEGKKILIDLYAYDLMYKDYDEAIGILKERLESEPKDAKQIKFDLLTLYERTGNLKDVVAMFEEELKKDPDNLYILNRFAQIAHLAGKEEEVARLLAENIERNPGNVESWKGMINFRADAKEYDKANDWYLKMLSRFKNNKKLQKKYLEWLMTTNQGKGSYKIPGELARKWRKRRRIFKITCRPVRMEQRQRQTAANISQALRRRSGQSEKRKRTSWPSF